MQAKTGYVSDVIKTDVWPSSAGMQTRKQAARLLESVNLADIKIQRYAHRYLNIRKVIIRDRNLNYHSIDEMVSVLRDKCVLEAERVTF